jgi:hypothetical protein
MNASFEIPDQMAERFEASGDDWSPGALVLEE